MFKQALQAEVDVGNQNNQALVLNNINAYLSKADYQNARSYFEQALPLREKLKVPSNIADTLHNLGETSRQMGQYDLAVEQYLLASSPAASATSSPSEASLACWITLPCRRCRLSKLRRECLSNCRVLVEQVLLEENDKSQQRDSAHRHRKTDPAQIRLVVAQEQRPIGHAGQRE